MDKTLFKQLIEPRTIEDWRVYTHKWIDRLWKYSTNRQRARSRVYKWLAKKMDIPLKDCHISLFNVLQCKEAIKLAKRKINSKNNANRTK